MMRTRPCPHWRREPGLPAPLFTSSPLSIRPWRRWAVGPWPMPGQPTGSRKSTSDPLPNCVRRDSPYCLRSHTATPGESSSAKRNNAMPTASSSAREVSGPSNVCSSEASQARSHHGRTVRWKLSVPGLPRLDALRQHQHRVRTRSLRRIHHPHQPLLPNRNHRDFILRLQARIGELPVWRRGKRQWLARQ